MKKQTGFAVAAVIFLVGVAVIVTGWTFPLSLGTDVAAVQENIPVGQTSVMSTISPIVQVSADDPLYNSLLQGMGDWAYYTSPFKTLVGESASLVATVWDSFHNVLYSGSAVCSDVSYYFYGWQDSRLGVPSLMIMVGSVDVKVTSVSSSVLVTVNLHGPVTYSGSVNVKVYVYQSISASAVRSTVRVTPREEHEWTIRHEYYSGQSTVVASGSQTADVPVDPSTPGIDYYTVSTDSSAQPVSVESASTVYVNVNDDGSANVKALVNPISMVEVSQFSPGFWQYVAGAVLMGLAVAVGMFAYSRGKP